MLYSLCSQATATILRRDYLIETHRMILPLIYSTPLLHHHHPAYQPFVQYHFIQIITITKPGDLEYYQQAMYPRRSHIQQRCTSTLPRFLLIFDHILHF